MWSIREVEGGPSGHSSTQPVASPPRYGLVVENTRAGLATKLLPAHTAARGAKVLASGQLLGRAGEEMARYLQHAWSSVCIVYAVAGLQSGIAGIETRDDPC